MYNEGAAATMSETKDLMVSFVGSKILEGGAWGAGAWSAERGLNARPRRGGNDTPNTPQDQPQGQGQPQPESQPQGQGQVKP